MRQCQCVSELFLCEFCSRSVRDGRMGLGGFPTTEALCGSSNDMGTYSLSLYGYVDLVNWNSWSENYPPPPYLPPYCLPPPIPYPVPTYLVPITNTSLTPPPPPSSAPFYRFSTHHPGPQLLTPSPNPLSPPR